MNRRTLTVIAAGFLATLAKPARAQSGFEAAIYDACARHGCNGGQLIRVAACESGMDPNAVGIHGEIGLYQFMPETYAAYGGTDIWNPWEQVEVAAHMWSQGLGWHWVCQG